MPITLTYTLSWSSTHETYELSQTGKQQHVPITLDGPGWFAWLKEVSCFTFVGQNGHYIARRETRSQRGSYWYAYVTRNGRRYKMALGKRAAVTQARLESVAAKLGTSHEPPEAGHERQTLSASQVNSDGGSPPPSPAPILYRSALLPLLVTKLHAPRLRTRMVSRTNLLEQLQQGVEGPLTLISASAGFGKTTLLAQWLQESSMPTAWLSLESEDNDPTCFLSYLIAALQTLDAQVGVTALALLHTPYPPSPESVLAILINDLMDRGGGDVALVLDDYHAITSTPIQQGMAFLLEHLPPCLHLILASRTDPPLPLARLRARGQITELRAAELRFDTVEAGTFLRTVMGLNLEASVVAALESHTEGWIAGLQLAALSLQGRDDVSTFLEAFAGSHCYVFDYLSEEVLTRQSTPVQQFLLHTCILDCFSGPLCDVMTGQKGSQAMLEELERANLFVVALDDKRDWYRYHHLFVQVLRRHLQQREPTLLPVLHQRASAWYEQHEQPAEAVQHALAIPDVELAARLIEPIALPITFQGQLYTVLGWLSALPEALVRTRPFLCLYYARLLMYSNQFEAAEVRLQEAEAGIREEMPAEQIRAILGGVLSIRAGFAYFAGDIPHAISLAHQTLALLPTSMVLPRASAIVYASSAYLMSGDVTPAVEHEVAEAVVLIRLSGNVFSAVLSICLLAQLHVLQGKLRQAVATYAQVVQVIPRPEVLQTACSILSFHFGPGDLLREHNQLEEAEQRLMRGMELVNGTVAIEPFVAMLGYPALARVQQARGNTHAAFATLDALARLAEQRHLPSYVVTRGEAVRAQLELALGHLAAAIRWADTSGLSLQDSNVPYPRESEYLILARARIAQGREEQAGPLLQQVLQLLDQLQASAEVNMRMGSVLEILVLRALALAAQGDHTTALATLERALVQAASEGYIRLFVDEGAPMQALLRRVQVQAHSAVPQYLVTLLAAFGETLPVGRASLMPHSNGLLEPLTEREREVLHLLLEGASNREIAQRLVLSVNTVKRHVYNLCSKLGVQSRSKALVLARELPL